MERRWCGRPWHVAAVLLGLAALTTGAMSRVAREPVLAPFDGIVDSVIVNTAVNAPGTRGIGRAAVIVFRRADSTRVLYAHVQDIRVKPGDTVVAGQPIARVGNNGQAYFPHTHIGAWRGGRPLQIRFDLAAMGRMSLRAQ